MRPAAASETPASVLETDLSLEVLPADTPPAVRRVLSRCIKRYLWQL